MSVITENWQIRKPAVSSDKGLVATQHYIASDVGAEVLRRGGNAIDAAIAAGLTLGTVEPWMSGIGGGGYMTVYLAASREVSVVDFGMCAPFNAKTTDYPLAGEGENASDAFNWPKVVGDTNIHGPLSVAVPGYISGMAKALAEFGSWDWKDVIAPACEQADLGLPIDWYSAQKINNWARSLNIYSETRKTYLADGLPPAAELDGRLGRLPLGNLANTYRTLQQEGPETYYTGTLAQSIAADLEAAGSRITMEDLRDYSTSINSPLTTSYRGSTLYTPGALTAGPSIIHALGKLEEIYSPAGKRPDAEAYISYANALFSAYEDRLENLGEGPDTRVPGNTSHLCVTDSQGNVVSLTQTIMSAFGSRIMLPGSGILMNNGMMWFDPRPGGPNSVLGGRRPLCNMCPVILHTEDGSHTAIGACGGRKIFPAVFQLAAFVSDYDMTIDEAVHYPRLDVSGTDQVTIMEHADETILRKLEHTFPDLAVRSNGVNPNFFAMPQIIRREASGKMTGGCFVPSPHAKVSAFGET
ncbi:MAG: gamma-glutamyltransferase [Proteobacteria bacterium]|nr:gamma-glutamyltransferase [Pseudomonadota bacterium]